MEIKHFHQVTELWSQDGFIDYLLSGQEVNQVRIELMKSKETDKYWFHWRKGDRIIKIKENGEFDCSPPGWLDQHASDLITMTKLGMTIDQMNEIQEWLSPLDDHSVIQYRLEATGKEEAECCVEKYHGEWICDLCFIVKNGKISVKNPSESYSSLVYTSVWEQICLRCL